MKKNTLLLLICFSLFGVGCDGVKSMFGCDNSNRDDQPIDLQLGTPGETKVENNLPVNDNLVVLEETEEINFISDNGEAEITHAPDKEIHVDDVIIANEEQQYLVKVKEVISKKEGATKVVLRQGHISDIVGDQEGSLKIEATPVYSLDDLKSFMTRAELDQRIRDQVQYETDEKGRVVIRNLELFNIQMDATDEEDKASFSRSQSRLMGLPVENFSKRLTINTAAAGRYKAVVNEAIIEIVPTVRSDSRWTRGGKIAKLETRLDTRVRYRIDMTYEAAGQIQMEALYDILQKRIFPFRFPGPPPIHLDIEIAVPFGVNFSVKKQGKTRVIFETEYEFLTLMQYDPKSGIQTQKDNRLNILDKRMEVKEGDVNISAEMSLKPSITTRLYRILGPYVYMQPFLRGEFQRPVVEKKEDLFFGIGAGVGIELSEPIFLTSIVGYDSGRIWEKSMKWDLDDLGETPVAPKKIDSAVQDSVTIDEIGPEGFALLKVKEHKKDEFLKYELIHSPQTGLLIPSEGFYMNGELYYYPLPHSSDETFTIRIHGDNGRFEDREIAINLDSSVIAAVSEDRYGVTTNSYKVANGSPKDFEDQVPHYNLGGVGVSMREIIPAKASECLSMARDYGLNVLRFFEMYTECQSFIPYAERYIENIYRTAMGAEDKAEIDQVDFERFKNDYFNSKNSEYLNEVKFGLPYYLDSKNGGKKLFTDRPAQHENAILTFDWYNPLNFEDYVVSNAVEFKCPPRFEVRSFESDIEIGFEFVSLGCPDVSPALMLNAVNYNSANFTQFNLKWNESTDTIDDNIVVKRLTLAKNVLAKSLETFESFGNLTGAFSINFPIAGPIRSVNISAINPLNFFKQRNSKWDWDPQSMLNFEYTQTDLNHGHFHGGNDSVFDTRNFFFQLLRSKESRELQLVPMVPSNESQEHLDEDEPS